MDWYPVPSLQFQSALKIVTHIFTQPSVVGHYAGYPTEDYFEEEHERMKEDIITTLSLPSPVQEYLLSHTPSILGQLRDFYRTVKLAFKYEDPEAFPLKSKEELMFYVRWTSEGCIDLEQTVHSLQSIVDEKDQHYKEYVLACSYLLEKPLYCQWHAKYRKDRDRFFFLKEYQEYLDQKDILLKKKFFGKRAIWACIRMKNLSGVRTCWPNLTLDCRRQILRDLLSRYFWDDVTCAEIVRFCLLHCERTESTTAILLCLMSCERSRWPSLLWMFWVWPDKSVFFSLLKFMFEHVKSNEYSSLLVKEFKDGILFCFKKHPLFFQNIWKESPRAYKMELLKDKKKLISIVMNSIFKQGNAVQAAMILQSYSADEKRLFLQRYGFEMCAAMFIGRKDVSDDVIFQEFAVCQVDAKALTKEKLITNPPLKWMMNAGQLELRSWIQWSGLSLEEEIRLIEQFVEYKSAKVYSTLSGYPWYGLI